jgi:eukaryotic-like serine/threonine-protein kinase
MPVLPGKKLGPYEIISAIGAGGMGEVYRAKDTRLDRIVALKVLPSHLSSNTDVRQRFEREARAVSSLNHSHICTLYDVGHQDGIDYIVMEYIEGETLSSRLQREPLSTSDLLRYSIEVSDALDKAHRQGIVHRDLKPGNIMLTKAGAKLLDFGVAKLQSEKTNPGDLSSLPTEHRDLTKEGMVLGTFQYMAPEQLEGREADARTDIFAFGAVMYEMATSKKAFEGKSQASLVAAILKEDPKPMREIQPLTPPILERLVKTCLAKDPEDRWQNAHDITNELRWIAESSGAQTPPSTVEPLQAPPGKWYRIGRIMAKAAVLALALFTGFLLNWVRFNQKPLASTEVRFWIPPAPGTSLVGDNHGNPDFAISQDGTKLVYSVRESPEKDQLWLRKLDSLSGQPIAGTEGARLPFWSPDRQYIAFYSENRLKKISLSGGSPVVLCDVPNRFGGGAWLADGTIVFGSIASGLSRVYADGREPKPLTILDPVRKERNHSYPVFLPDGNHFIYACDSYKAEERAIYMGTLNSKETVRLVGSPYKGGYVDPGYLLFLRGTSLMGQRLEMHPPRLIGEPILIADQLSVNSVSNDAPFTSSRNGVILYRSGGAAAKTQLAWFDRAGKALGKVSPIESDISVKLSPDGTQAAISSVTGSTFRSGAGEPSLNIWVIDLARGVRTRVTLDPAVSDENPIWSPDGRYLAFASHRKAFRAQIYEKSSSGEGQDKPILLGEGNEHPIDWSPDGKFLLVHANGNGIDLMVLPLTGEPKPIPLLSSSADEAQGQFSPDGRWVAYTSSESGRNEVYVKQFPKGESKWQISSAGGSEPRWRGDGRELFYLAPDGTIMAVSVKAGSSLEVAPPVALFKTGITPANLNAWGGAHQYDVTKDGSRFLISSLVVPAIDPNLNVIVNWNPSR